MLPIRTVKFIYPFYNEFSMENNFSIKYRKINPLVSDDSEKERYEEHYFSAQENGKEIGHLITTKITEPLDDLEIELRNPVASFGSIDTQYRRKGVMTELLYEANDFCLKKYSQPLISGFNDSKNMNFLWEKLEKQNKVEKRDYNGLEYWIMK